jgi:hypothetical protein
MTSSIFKHRSAQADRQAVIPKAHKASKLPRCHPSQPQGHALWYGVLTSVSEWLTVGGGVQEAQVIVPGKQLSDCKQAGDDACQCWLRTHCATMHAAHCASAA